MSENVRTEIIMVLDRSGSMGSCADDVIGGFNAFIEDQKKVEGEAKITLAQFDTEYDLIYDNVPLADVKGLKFNPRGSTALLDAIGRTIIATKTRIKTQRPGPDAVIFVVITDGQENASKEFKKEQIQAMIKECETQDNWKIVYLGANQDAFEEAGGLGVSGHTGTMTYDTNKTDCMFCSVSKGTSEYRSKVNTLSEDSRGVDVDALKTLNQTDFFSDEDRKKQQSEKDRKDQTKFGVKW